MLASDLHFTILNGSVQVEHHLQSTDNLYPTKLSSGGNHQKIFLLHKDLDPE